MIIGEATGGLVAFFLLVILRVIIVLEVVSFERYYQLCLKLVEY